MQSGSYLGIATSLTVRGRRKHVEATIKEIELLNYAHAVETLELSDEQSRLLARLCLEGGSDPEAEGAADLAEGGSLHESEGGSHPEAEGGSEPQVEGGSHPEAEGGSESPPVEGGSEPPPAEGGSEPPPAEGGSEPPPAEGGSRPTDPLSALGARTGVSVTFSPLANALTLRGEDTRTARSAILQLLDDATPAEIFIDAEPTQMALLEDAATRSLSILRRLCSPAVVALQIAPPQVVLTAPARNLAASSAAARAWLAEHAHTLERLAVPRGAALAAIRQQLPTLALAPVSFEWEGADGVPPVPPGAPLAGAPPGVTPAGVPPAGASPPASNPPPATPALLLVSGARAHVGAAASRVQTLIRQHATYALHAPP